MKNKLQKSIIRFVQTIYKSYSEVLIIDIQYIFIITLDLGSAWLQTVVSYSNHKGYIQHIMYVYIYIYIYIHTVYIYYM